MANLLGRLLKLEKAPALQERPQLTLVLKYQSKEEYQAAVDRDARYPLTPFKVVHVLSEVTP